MPYPEKIAFPDKKQRRPLLDPEGQVSADEINLFRDKLNANALFYDVHDDLAALQAKFSNPPKGAFAYLLDGSCYRCVNLGWTTDPTTPGGGGGATYFKGYFVDTEGGQSALDKLRIAYPNGEPGWRAVLRVVGGNDKEAIWDEDDADWFTFEFSSSISQAYVDQKAAETLEASKAYARSLTGGQALEKKIISVSRNYQGGMDFKFSAHWIFYDQEFGTETEPVVQPITLNAADATHGRFDAVVLNNQGQIVKITGNASATPEKPTIDPDTQIEVTFFFIPANAAAPDRVSNTPIYNEGAAPGWTVTETTGGARINLASGVDPQDGTISIEATGIKRYDSVTFTADVPIDAGEIRELPFFFKNKVAYGGTNPLSFTIYGKTSSGESVGYFLGNLQAFGYDLDDTSTYQDLSIPIDKPTLIFITGFKIQYVGLDSANFGFFLDNIRYTKGDYIRAEDFISREEYDLKVAELESALASNLQSAKDHADQKDAPVIVDISRELTAADIDKILFVIASVTLTWPSPGISNFRANLECNAGGAAVIADQAQTPGEDLDAPNGSDIEADGSAYLFIEPVNGKLRISK
ncbi:hypothetical protein JM79_3218 [Gramella sp. Hel_I_59]|uniref:hypothetical protein n=1 Tax=Gramella sp. Hel_I_59 TaxID=1249978 RepID=UPI0011546CA2|nr:hypothetical protein [Gramella sp. Hel_I_59]TQI72261.1 hypothetical protein JM79_3218 [Gramella sp. Hel_I_59]